MPRSKGRVGRPWRRARALVLATSSACHLCGHEVDKTLPPGDPLSAVVDHLLPLSKGGDPLALENLRLAHRRCNGRKHNRTDAAPIRTSRAW